MKQLCIVIVTILSTFVSPPAMARRRSKKAAPDTADSPVAASPARTPATIEETIVRLVEEEQIREAQAEAKSSGLAEDRLTRVTGILLFAVGETTEAMDFLKRAHQENPSDPRIALYLAEALCAKKDFATARSLAEGVSNKVLAEQPRPWEPTFRKAKVLSWLHDTATAKTLYTSILEMPGASARFISDARVGLAEIASWQKDYDGAMRLLTPVLASTPGHVEATLVRGQVLEWQEKYKDAKGIYSAALQVHPNDAQLRWRLEKLSWVK